MHFGLEFGEGAIERPAAWIEDDGPLAAQGRQFETDGFPQAASDSVAHDCLSQRPGRGEPDAGAFQTRMAGGIGEAERCEERTRVASALVINLAEIARSQDSYTFRETRSTFKGARSTLWQTRSGRIRDPATAPS